MDQSPESSHASHPHDSPGTHQISCTNCRKRKIKCSRVEPCGPCQRAGVECIFRARAPRSHNKGKDPKSREVELLLRLSRLEGLVSKIDPAAIREARGDSEGHSPPVVHGVSFSGSPKVPEVPASGIEMNRIDGMFSQFVKKQEHWTRHVNSDFWNDLTGEISGLRQLLEEPLDDRDDEDDMTDLTPPKHTPPYFLFGESDPQNLDNQVPYPDPQHRSILFRYYFENVDPIYKILHRPTADSFLTNAQELIDESEHRYKFISLEAVTFSMYFAAVSTLSPEQCMQYFAQHKDALLLRYRRGTEVALLRGDFLNSMNVVFLHAFVIYIIGLRASRHSQSCWTFIGLAIRIAWSLGLHRDGDGSLLNAHEAEVRRRIWWQIFSLDMKASEDRGCEPMLAESYFNTSLPLNMEDDDFNKFSVRPLLERKGITSMTFSMIAFEVAKVTQKLHFVPLSHTQPALTLQEKEEMARECIGKIDGYFLDNYDSTNPFHLTVYLMSRIQALRLWLGVQYPMQRMYPSPEIQPRSRGLRNVVELLSMADSLHTNEYASRFGWHFETSVSWHPLAVALAELCRETEGPLADEAWRVINKYWARWSLRVEGSQEGKMWRPVKRLLKRAREARQNALQLRQTFQATSLSESSVVRSENVAEKQELPDYNPCNTTFENNVPLEPTPQNQTNSGAFDPYSWNSWNFNNGTYPEMNNMAGDTAMPMNWDDWNAFIYDAGTLNAAIPDDSWADPASNISFQKQQGFDSFGPGGQNM